ncbi:hypothetical protein [Saccharothrix yanglingensis]|uniref:Lipoprotein n=1 Tax=Saccharothrix yanglingensis TaxID=659496 RepID=A0ABU0X0V3_9PSEU|nr:hypothetical protein [Saccharothrix yanglingensis]MDQ2585681.1 hypothetical protein [Saccharothrix yanglingensis]
MHLRRVPALTAALALALTLGLSACATTVTGKPVAAAGGGSAAEKTTSGKPSSTRTSAAQPTASRAPETSGKKPSGDVKIATRKKTEGYEDCDILAPEDVAAAVGAAKGGEKGCVQSTEDPFAVVLFMVTFAEYEGQARTIEVGGNTAYEVKESGGDCSVIVMLTDDPDEITPAFLASVTPIDEIDPCAIALKLATKGFEKIPNA